MNLEAVRRIAMTYVPKSSGDAALMLAPHYGPAHEIGHLLVAARSRIGRYEFGITNVNPTSSMQAEETAACIVHTWIVAACDEARGRVPIRKLHAVVMSGSPDDFRRAVAAGYEWETVLRSWRKPDPGVAKPRLFLAKAKALLARRGVERRAVQNECDLIALCQRARTA